MPVSKFLKKLENENNSDNLLFKDVHAIRNTYLIIENI